MAKTILVADDEEIVRDYVSRALSSRGYTVKTAADGGAALALAREEGFDLLICDLKMPDRRGEKVISDIKALLPAARIIVITGSVSDVPSPLMPGLKADGVLIKPFGIDEIRDMAAKVLAL